MALSTPFKTQLKALRPVLNERAEMMRRSPAGLDLESFNAFLEESVDPIVIAAAKSSPERLTALVDALFTIALSVVSSGHAGSAARHDYVNRLWRDVAPSLTALVNHDPLESLGALTNAMIKVAGNRNINSGDWLRYMGEVAPEAQDVAALKSLCIITAWRSGGAAMREAALEAASSLPQDLACKSVGAPKTAKWDKVQRRLMKDRWWRPDGLAAAGHIVGGFAGFQGAFMSPPIVTPLGDGFWVESDNLHFHLIADGFGAHLDFASLQELEDMMQDTTPQQTQLEERRNPAWATIFPIQGLKLAHNADSVAASSPHSYSIHIAPASGAA